jgi:hypothetical protein
MGQQFRFSLYIAPQAYLRYYQGTASQVSVLAEDGRRIQFPAHHLRPFVTPDGILGRFEMMLDGDNRLISIRRL